MIYESINEEIPYKFFFGVFDSIKETLTKRWLLTSTELAKLITNSSTLFDDEEVVEFFEEWNFYFTGKKSLPFHLKEHGRWTDGWSTFILKVLFDGEYGIEEIGIGYPRINSKFWDKISPKIRMKNPDARHLIPKLMSKSFSGKNATEFEFALFSKDRMEALNPKTNSKANHGV